MTKRVQRKLASFLLIVQLFFSLFAPFSPFIGRLTAQDQSSPANFSEFNTESLEFDSKDDQLIVESNQEQLNYSYYYLHQDVTQAEQGELSYGGNSLFVGTESSGHFINHDYQLMIFKAQTAGKTYAYYLHKQESEIEVLQVVGSDDLELSNDELDWLENYEVAEVSEETLSTVSPQDFVEWEVDETSQTAVTKDTVRLNVEYIFPLEEAVTVTFTKLPAEEADRSNLRIAQVKVSELNLPESFTTKAEYAYDITTDMENGTFQFDLTLPKIGQKDNEVTYIEKSIDEAKAGVDEQEIKKVEQNKIKARDEVVKVTALDHLTLFIPVDGAEMRVTASLEGETQVTVNPDQSIRVDLEVGGDEEGDVWRSSSWQVQGESLNCVDHQDHDVSSGSANQSFDITAPGSNGTYDVSFAAYTDDTCSSGASDTFTLTEGIIVDSEYTIPDVSYTYDADDPIAFKSVTGIWTSVTSYYQQYVEGVGTNEVRWGRSSGHGKSGLRFDGSGLQSFDTGDTFYLGSLTHFNFPIYDAADGATLKITLEFEKPDVSPSPEFSFFFHIDETPNVAGQCPEWQISDVPCDDMITFPSIDETASFEIEDRLYTLKIEGFVDSYPDGELLPHFITEEEKASTAFLVGSLSSVLIEEPGISIKKKTNNIDVIEAPGPELYVGDTVTWQYIVQNIGNVELTDINVTDDPVVNIDCEEQTTLAAGADMTCTASGTVLPGQFTNTATVVGSHDGGTVQDSDQSWYYGVYGDAELTVCKEDTEGNTISNWEMTLGEDTQVTGSNGCYTWAVTEPGTYIVTEETREGWTPQGDTSVEFVVTSGMEDQSHTFVNFSDVDLMVCKEDAEGNRVSGWEVSLEGDQQLTGLNGCYTWVVTEPGTYTATEEDREGWTPVGAITHDFLITSGLGSLIHTFINLEHDPAIQVVKSSDTAFIDEAGQEVEYTFTVTNEGNITLTGITIDDPICDEAPEYVSGDDGDGKLQLDETWIYSCTYTVTQEDIDSNGNATDEQAEGFIYNTVTVSSAEEATDTDDHNIPVEQDPSLEINKVADVETVNAEGDVISYTITVENTGNQTLTGVSVTDLMLLDLDCDPNTEGNQTTDLTIEVETTLTCTGTYTVTQADIDNNGNATPPDGYIYNTVTADSSETDEETAMESVKVIQDAAIQVVKSSNTTLIEEAGQIVNYTFTVTNEGNVTLTGVTVTDPHCTPLYKEGDVNEDGKLQLDEIWVYECEYTVLQSDIDSEEDLSNTVTAGSNESDEDTDTLVIEVSYDPEIVILKTGVFNDEDGDGYADAGETITYTFTVSNTGNVTLTGITVTDPLLGGLVDSCSEDTLAVGASTTCTATYAVDQDDIDLGRVENTATADSDQTEPVTDDETVVLPQNEDMTIVKTGMFNDENEDGYADAGETITYTFTVSNTGNVTLTGITVTDPLLGGLVDSCSEDTLAVGASTTCTATYAVDQDDIDLGRVDNEATADSDQTEPVKDDETVELLQNPALSIDKTTSPSTYDSVGTEISYSYLLTNAGNVTLEAPFAVTDDKVSVTCPSSPTSLAPRETITCTATYVIVQEDLDSPYHVTNTASGTAYFNDVPVGSEPDTATVTFVSAKILFDQTTAVNDVNDPHTFTVTVMKNLGEGWIPASGEQVDFNLTDGEGAASVLDENESTCYGDGANTNDAGQCTIVFNSASPGIVTVNASVEIEVEIGEITLTLTRSTDGEYGSDVDAVKTYEAGRIIIEKATIPTDSDQSFEFEGDWSQASFFLGNEETEDSGWLAPGQYSVEEIVPEGWDLTDISCSEDGEENSSITESGAELVLESGETITCTFTNTQRGQVQVYKFDDEYISGQFDAGDELLSGWDMTISSVEDEFSQTETTQMSDGSYAPAAFSLIPGDYSLSETLQEGWEQSAMYCELQGEMVEGLITAPGEAYGHHGYCSGWNACGDAATCAQWACEINGYDYLVSYGAERPCTQFEMCHLFYNRGNIQWNWGNWCNVMGVSEIVCSQSAPIIVGQAPFINQVLGINQVLALEVSEGLEVEESQQPVNSIDLSVNPGDNINCYVGNYQLGSIYGDKYFDADQDGQYDSDEITLSDWEIALIDGEDQLATQTDADGRYYFESLTAGTYTVCEEDRTAEGWQVTEPSGSLCQEVVINRSGQEAVANFGNYINSRLLIEKTNNVWPNDQETGDEVTYTIQVMADEGPVYGVRVFDLLPQQFEYVAGSFTAKSSTGADLKANGTTAEPNYASPGVWELGNLLKDEIVTLTYRAVIGDDIDPGIYPDMVWALGTSAEDYVINQETTDNLLALSDPDFTASVEGVDFDGSQGHYGEDYFAGTQVAVVTDLTPSARYQIERTEEKEGEVLGITTELPATGARFWLTILALFSILSGAGLLLWPKFARRFSGKLLLIAAALGTSLLMAQSVHALSSVRLGEPYNASSQFNRDAITNQTEFKIDFVVLNTDNLSVQAQCQQRQDGGSWSDITTSYTVRAGGNSGICEVSGLSNQSQYDFRVRVTGDGDPQYSNLVRVNLDTDRPSRPVRYKKTEDGHCAYKIEFKTADDDRTTRVEVYRTTNSERLSANADTRIADISIGPDETHVFSTSKPNCERDYYYAIRAFDRYNNASGLVGDREIVTIIVEPSEETIAAAVAEAEAAAMELAPLPVSDVGVADVSLIPDEEIIDEEVLDDEIDEDIEEVTLETEEEEIEGEVLGEAVETIWSLLSRWALPLGIGIIILLAVYFLFIAKKNEK